MILSKKHKFLLINLAKGLGWLVVFMMVFVLVKDDFSFAADTRFFKYGNNPLLIFGIYSASEIVVGVFPPELFMMWSLKFAEHRNYIFDLALLASISYAAGTLTYLFGRYFNGTIIYRYLRKRHLRKYEELFNEYGGFLLFVAAVTPIPYSAICMLLGSVKYPITNFFLIALFRLVRFAVYGYFVWQASLL